MNSLTKRPSILKKERELSDKTKYFFKTRQKGCDIASENMANISQIIEKRKLQRQRVLVKSIKNRVSNIEISELKGAIENKSDSSAEIAIAYVEKGDLEKALEAVEKILNKYRKSQVFAEIAIAYVEKGKIKEAEKIAKDIFDRYWKSKAFAEIVKGYLGKGELEEAEKANENISHAFSLFSPFY